MAFAACEASAPAVVAKPAAASKTASAEIAPHVCGGAGECPGAENAGKAEPHPGPLPGAAETAGQKVFGSGLKLPGPALDVAEVLLNPAPHLGKTLQCSGTIARVCERMGCWLELQGPTAEKGLRVPMAGHAFFIPREAVGHQAVIEGELSAAGLSPEAQKHLESEGLKSIGPLSLAATSVVIAGM
jgi:hypothetical protein